MLDRTLASGKRQLFFDLNPKAPSHWFYNEFLDWQDQLAAKGENPNYNYGHFTIHDNASIKDEILTDEIAKYDPSSVWFQRDILGLRTNANGRIYTSYDPKECSITMEEIRKLRFSELAIGIDVGGTDATVATLTGRTHDGMIVHIDGMYHKQDIDNKMDEAAYCRMVADWMQPLTRAFPMIGTVYVDSANKLFRAGLRNELIRRGMNRFNVHAFDKSDGILQRIELTCMLMAQGRYKVCDRLKKWHEAIQMATWDTNQYERGEWVRTDDGSYPVDCLDSAEYSFYSMKRYL